MQELQSKGTVSGGEATGVEHASSAHPKALEEKRSGSRKRTKDTSRGVLSPTRSLHALLQSGNRISFGGLPKSDSACHLVGQQPCQGPLPPSMILASVSLRRAAPANHRQTTSHYHSKLDD